MNKSIIVHGELLNMETKSRVLSGVAVVPVLAALK